MADYRILAIGDELRLDTRAVVRLLQFVLPSAFGIAIRCRARYQLLSMIPNDLPSTSRAAAEFRYEKLTWPEINDAIEMGKVCVVPCGAVEQHGAHLPLDVDIVCPTGIAHGAGRLIPVRDGGKKSN